jgi:copper chaperone CopZ
MQTVISVTGMSCGHCVAAVTRALEKVPGVEKAAVSLEQSEAVVTGSAEPGVLLEAIREEGYEAALK